MNRLFVGMKNWFSTMNENYMMRIAHETWRPFFFFFFFFPFMARWNEQQQQQQQQQQKKKKKKTFEIYVIFYFR